MSQQNVQGEVFSGIDFTQSPLEVGEYENCEFTDCNFSGCDLAFSKFAECSFSFCNLSLTKLHNTALRNVRFRECKMLGLRFEDTNAFGFSVSFSACQLDHSSFYKVHLKKCSFANSRLQEVDFTESELTGADFQNCDLSGALFEGSVLDKADLRTAYNYTIDPERNRLKKARLSLGGIAGLLRKYDLVIDNNL